MSKRLKSWGFNHADSILKNPLFSRTNLLQGVFYKKPQTIYVEVTNECNLRCGTCRREMGERKFGFMSFDLFMKIIDDAAAIGGVRLLLYFGGEPLMHPDFLKMLKYAVVKRSQFRDVGFFTNGMLLNEKIVDNIIELGVDNVTLSLDGIGLVNEKLRCGSSYPIIEKNINYLLKARGKQSTPKIIINSTISNQTDEELTAIKETWQNRLDEVRFSGMIGTPFKILDLKRARNWNPNYLQQKVCLEPFSNLAVLWDGDVAFCCQDIYGKGVIGNINDSDLMGIWNGKELKKIRHSLLTGNVEKTILCNKCEIFDFKNHKVKG